MSGRPIGNRSPSSGNAIALRFASLNRSPREAVDRLRKGSGRCRIRIFQARSSPTSQSSDSRSARATARSASIIEALTIERVNLAEGAAQLRQRVDAGLADASAGACRRGRADARWRSIRALQLARASASPTVRTAAPPASPARASRGCRRGSVRSRPTSRVAGRPRSGRARFAPSGAARPTRSRSSGDSSKDGSANCAASRPKHRAIPSLPVQSRTRMHRARRSASRSCGSRVARQEGQRAATRPPRQKSLPRSARPPVSIRSLPCPRHESGLAAKSLPVG